MRRFKKTDMYPTASTPPPPHIQIAQIIYSLVWFYEMTRCTKGIKLFRYLYVNAMLVMSSPKKSDFFLLNEWKMTKLSASIFH